jgi:hypothetical protein
VHNVGIVGTDQDHRIVTSEWIAFVIALVVRGFLLWMLVPFVAVVWAAATPLRLFKSVNNRPKLGQYICWADTALIASLERGPLRLLVREPNQFGEWPRQRGEPPYKISFRELT